MRLPTEDGECVGKFCPSIGAKQFLATGDDAAAMLAELEALFAKKFDEA